MEIKNKKYEICIGDVNIFILKYNIFGKAKVIMTFDKEDVKSWYKLWKLNDESEKE